MVIFPGKKYSYWAKFAVSAYAKPDVFVMNM